MRKIWAVLLPGAGAAEAFVFANSAAKLITYSNNHQYTGIADVVQTMILSVIGLVAVLTMAAGLYIRDLRQKLADAREASDTLAPYAVQSIFPEYFGGSQE